MAEYQWHDEWPAEAASWLWGDVDSDWEELCDSPEEAIERLSDDCHPEPVDWPIRLAVYKRMEVTEEWADRHAQYLLEWWQENWAGEFHADSHAEVRAGVEEDDAEAMKVLCRKMAKQSVPWNCERTGDVIVVPKDWDDG